MRLFKRADDKTGVMVAHVQLARREAEVLGHLIDCMVAKDIAVAMHISPATVHRHIANMLKGLQLDRIGCLMLWGYQRVKQGALTGDAVPASLISLDVCPLRKLFKRKSKAA